MSICVKTLYKVFPEIKAFGCCHEVFGTQKLLASMIKEVTGTPNVSRQDIKINVLGINHFTWITEATYVSNQETIVEAGLSGNKKLAKKL